MSNPRSLSFLKQVLLADAVVSGATGLLLVVGATALSSLLGLPWARLLAAGAILLPYAALVGWLATRESPARAAVWAVIACNVLWALDSVLLLVAGWVHPTSLGVAFVIAQAVIVALLAELQAIGLRRSRTLALG